MATEDESKKRKIDEVTEEEANGEEVKVEETEASKPKTSPNISHEGLRRILSFLTEDQAMQMLFDSCLNHPDVLSTLSENVGKSVARKIFVRGLSFDVSGDDLKAAFEEFGELEEALVITEKGTSRSRGYGFVTFKEIYGCLNALTKSSKVINGRTSYYHLAAIGSTDSSTTAPTQDLTSSRKIYIGNVPIGATGNP